MKKSHLNTLFVTTEGSYVGKQGEAVVVRQGDEKPFRVPIHLLHSIICMGHVNMSPQLMALCAERDVSISFHRPSGRLVARVTGFAPGNVLLRKAQFRASDQPGQSMDLARSFVLGKLLNQRVLVLRAIRDHGEEGSVLSNLAERLRGAVTRIRATADHDSLRGIEGETAALYFRAWPQLLRRDEPGVRFEGRNRRPPRDPVNALLSFAYAILASDTRSACESVGLDSQVGFLHSLRSGRPALALDLMEELRPVVADRVVLSLVNRQQITARDFSPEISGAVRMKDSARKRFLVEFQRRKQEVIEHPFLGEKVTLGQVPFLQARLLAKALRGELDAYPPFLWR
jgi:CRISPR-associated protein Cas1